MVSVDSFLVFLIIVIEINIVADRKTVRGKNVLWNVSMFEEEHTNYAERCRRFPLIIQTHTVHKICDNAPTSLYHTTYRGLSDAKLGTFFFCSTDVTDTAAPNHDDIRNGFHDFIWNVKSLMTILYFDCNL